MVAFAECFAPEKPAAEPKTRVWDFFGPDADRVGESASQVVDRDWEMSFRLYDSRRSPSSARSTKEFVDPLWHGNFVRLDKADIVVYYGFSNLDENRKLKKAFDVYVDGVALADTLKSAIELPGKSVGDMFVDGLVSGTLGSSGTGLDNVAVAKFLGEKGYDLLTNRPPYNVRVDVEYSVFKGMTDTWHGLWQKAEWEAHRVRIDLDGTKRFWGKDTALQKGADAVADLLKEARWKR